VNTKLIIAVVLWIFLLTILNAIGMIELAKPLLLVFICTLLAYGLSESKAR